MIESILALDPKLFVPEQRQEIDAFLGKLVRLGAPEAYGLEKALREIQ